MGEQMSEPGRMMAEARLEFVRTFPVKRETLWAYLVEDERRRRWICGGDVEPRVGGRIVFDFDHRRLSTRPPPDHHADQQTVRFEGEVLIWDPPRRLAFSWPEADGATGTEVTITLTETDDGTEMRLVHTRLESAEYRLGAAAGWHSHLDLLADLVAGNEARDFWVSYADTEAFYRESLAGS